MIGKHCGVRLKRITRDYPAVSCHVWQCPKCGRTFSQAVRKGKR